MKDNEPCAVCTRTDTIIETCLVCKVAWDTSYDPPACSVPHHPHALAVYDEWDRVCHGRIQ